MDLPAIDRAHADRMMTWLTTVLGRQDGDTLHDFKLHLYELSKTAANGEDSEAKIIAVLAEVGFYAVIDNMLEQINMAEGDSHGT